jgi:hypothetical protein
MNTSSTTPQSNFTPPVRPNTTYEFSYPFKRATDRTLGQGLGWVPGCRKGRRNGPNIADGMGACTIKTLSMVADSSRPGMMFIFYEIKWRGPEHQWDFGWEQRCDPVSTVERLLQGYALPFTVATQPGSTPPQRDHLRLVGEETTAEVHGTCRPAAAHPTEPDAAPSAQPATAVMAGVMTEEVLSPDELVWRPCEEGEEADGREHTYIIRFRKGAFQLFRDGKLFMEPFKTAASAKHMADCQEWPFD